jgi:hypothetical protein
MEPERNSDWRSDILKLHDPDGNDVGEWNSVYGCGEQYGRYGDQ